MRHQRHSAILILSSGNKLGELWSNPGLLHHYCLKNARKEMEHDKSINIGQLRTFVNRVFDFIEHDLGYEKFDLTRNFYWSISDDQLFDLTQQPTKIDCGSLVGDVEFLEIAMKNQEQAFPMMFLHLAPLLQAMAKGIPSYTTRDDKGSAG